MIPESGAEYSYLLRGVGPLPAFLFAWMFVLLLRPASMAIMSLTCAQYILVPILFSNYEIEDVSGGGGSSSFEDGDGGGGSVCGMTMGMITLKKKMLAAVCICECWKLMEVAV